MLNPLTYILLISIFLSQSITPLASINQDSPDVLYYQTYLPVVDKQSCRICYYIDSQNGSDYNSGTQPDQAWKTFSNLDTDQMQPGTIVYLKRDSIWNGSLYLYASGTSNSPITITAYGSGSAPILSNPQDTDNDDSVIYLRGSYIIIDNLQIRQSGTGITIFSDHNIIRNSEITNTGIGIAVNGQYNLITQNYIHDLHMMHSDAGGYDDWGANGVDILNAHNEISFNRFVNCEAFSYDFGTGGGAVEIYQVGDYTSIHHNWSFQTSGFIEVSSNGSGSAKNVSIFYNVIINATRFTVIHISNASAVQIDNFRVENNTIIDLRPHNPIIGRYIVFLGTPSPDAYIFRNNIVYISDYYWVSTEEITHDNNIYYFTNSSTRLGYALGPGELIANPQFMDITKQDFHLMPISPAINSGIDLGYTVDFDINPVPVYSVPDPGAYEFQGN